MLKRRCQSINDPVEEAIVNSVYFLYCFRLIETLGSYQEPPMFKSDHGIKNKLIGEYGERGSTFFFHLGGMTIFYFFIN